jgi:replication factor A1
MNKNYSLSQGALKEILACEPQEKGKSYNINHTLQVIGPRKKEDQKSAASTNIYTCYLSDGEFKHGGFVVFHQSDSEIHNFDIIRVYNLVVNILGEKKGKVYIIKKFEVIDSPHTQIGNPDNVKDDGTGTMSKERVSSSIAGNSSNNLNINQPRQPIQNNNNQGGNNYQGGQGQNDFSFSNNRGQNNSGNQNRGKLYHPLSSLTTFSKDIQILVRVLKKTEKKNFSGRNPGCLFSFTIMDVDGNELGVTCFNKACEKFCDVIQEGKVYEIMGGYVKINDKKYGHSKSDYKLHLDENTRVEEKEDEGQIKQISFNFVKIGDLGNFQLHSVVDLFVYVLECGEKQLKNTKNGEQTIRKLVVCDDSEHKIEFTLWKNHSETEISQGNIISIKNAKIGDFNGKSLSTVDDTHLVINPDLNEARELESYARNFTGEWKSFGASGGQGSGDNNSTAVMNLKEILHLLDTESDDKINTYRLKATICHLNHSERNFYAGCTEKNCKKKLQQETYSWICVSCNKTTDSPHYYYTLSFRVKDSTGEHWLDMFGDSGQKLFEVTANDYKDMILNKDDNSLKAITNRLEFKTFSFVVKPKTQYYQNVPKKKINAYRADNVDIVAEVKRLTKNLSSVLGLSSVTKDNVNINNNSFRK